MSVEFGYQFIEVIGRSKVRTERGDVLKVGFKSFLLTLFYIKITQWKNEFCCRNTLSFIQTHG